MSNMVGSLGLGYLQSVSSLHGAACSAVHRKHSGSNENGYYGELGAQGLHTHVVILFNSHNKQERMSLCPFYREEKQDLKSLETGLRPQSKNMAKLGAVAEDYWEARTPNIHSLFPS